MDFLRWALSALKIGECGTPKMSFSNISKKTIVCLALVLSHFHGYAGIYYVSTAGDDNFGDGSSIRPWRTLRHAVTKVAANQGHTIMVGAGTFVEKGLIEVPLGVSVVGAGVDVTIFKSASSFYYHPPVDPGYGTNHFLISLSEFNQLDGNQTLRNFTIDGDSKQLHGGIYVRYRNKVVIDEVKVQNTNYTGIWLWDVKDSQLTNTQLVNCSWGSTGYSSGALNVGNLERVEISQLMVDENTGYGIKALGPDGYNDIFYLKMHDCHISVTPFGLWNNGSAPNIAIELWQSTLVGCEIYNTYVDNTISLVNSAVPSTGIQTIRVHDNIFDMETRANGSGYGLELSIHDAEIDHNYFIKGTYGIANWDNPMQNWNIHHNIFYALEELYIGEVVRSQWSGLHHVKLYNNTIEFAGDKTMNVVGLYGGISDNIDIKNNLVINSNTGYNFYPNQLIHTENGAAITSGSLQVLNNSTTNLDPGSLITSLLGLLNPLINLTVQPNPAITKSGSRPSPYYIPAPGSSIINAGLNVGFLYAGSAPDIGAYESDPYVVPNQPPIVSMVYPANRANYPTGSSIPLAANASDPDGTIAKVEFFNGTTKLGEVLTSPYHFVWSDPPAGKASLTVRAKDNQNGITTSTTIPITITSGTLLDSTSTGIVFGLYAPEATLTGTMTLTMDSTASRGSYFSVSEGNGKNDSLPPPATATFNFQLPISDTYAVWVRVHSQPADHQRYFINPGTGNWTTWEAGVNSEWSWVKITDPSSGLPAMYTFSEGFNTFTMGWYDENVQVDRIMITNDSNFDPSLSNPMKDVILYPNPATDKFYLEYTSTLSQQTQVCIYDINSRLVKQLFVAIDIGQNEIPIDIHDLSNGIYIVSLLMNNGQKYSVRIVILH
ncbi:MAG: T9SS type A sorting domain-containing protein [Bacteroidetes bacterium]|nr:T9SS type A sorting domain-containing protein [Bacteroidota bacterium]